MDSETGTRFRVARERHRVTLAQAAAHLDVDPALLAAVEAGSIDDTANEVVAKAHVRVYARYLGFDSEAVLRGRRPGVALRDAPVAAHAAALRGGDPSQNRRDAAPAGRSAAAIAAAADAIRPPRPAADPEPDRGSGRASAYPRVPASRPARRASAAAARSGAAGGSAPQTTRPGVVGEAVDEPVEPEVDDDRPGRRALLLLAIGGSVLAGILIALLLGSPDGAADDGADGAAPPLPAVVASRG